MSVIALALCFLPVPTCFQWFPTFVLLSHDFDMFSYIVACLLELLQWVPEHVTLHSALCFSMFPCCPTLCLLCFTSSHAFPYPTWQVVHSVSWSGDLEWCFEGAWNSSGLHCFQYVSIRSYLLRFYCIFLAFGNHSPVLGRITGQTHYLGLPRLEKVCSTNRMSTVR